MRQQQLEKEVLELREEIAKLHAEIDNLQAPRTIVDILGRETFDHMIELYPSFREDGRPTTPLMPASEVMWSAVRMMRHIEQQREDAMYRAVESGSDFEGYADLYARHQRATNALAEYAMRSIEEYEA